MDRSKKFISLILSWFVVAFLASGAIAQHKHDHGSAPAPSTQMGQGHEKSMMGGPAQSVTVDGYKITLEVMDMSAHMSMPGMKSSMDAAAHAKSHALMVRVQDTASKEIISDARIQYILTTPAGAKESGKLEWSGDYYNGGFSPKEKGNYQIELKIESSGMERTAKFAYQG